MSKLKGKKFRFTVHRMGDAKKQHPSQDFEVDLEATTRHAKALIRKLAAMPITAASTEEWARKLREQVARWDDDADGVELSRIIGKDGGRGRTKEEDQNEWLRMYEVEEQQDRATGATERRAPADICKKIALDFAREQSEATNRKIEPRTPEYIQRGVREARKRRAARNE